MKGLAQGQGWWNEGHLGEARFKERVMRRVGTMRCCTVTQERSREDLGGVPGGAGAGVVWSENESGSQSF